MFAVTKLRVALTTAAGCLAVVGSALATSPALAGTYNFTNKSGGSNVAAGVPYTSTSTSAQISFGNSSGSQTYFECRTSSLDGKTTLNGSTSGTTSNGLAVTGVSFGTCTSAGALITLMGNFSAPWQISPAGTASPFALDIANISLTIACGSSSVTYGGSFTTSEGVTETNASPSYISAVNAGPLAKSGTGCAALPGPIYASGAWTLATVNGSTASATNNLWLNYSA